VSANVTLYITYLVLVPYVVTTPDNVMLSRLEVKFLYTNRIFFFHSSPIVNQNA